MGIVFKARHLKLNRIVAIKVTKADDQSSREETLRFQAEAEAVANLDHPNIVPIYEIGVDGGRQWFSMALIEGQSLAQEVRTGPLPARRSAETIEKVARAVDYAHQRGVIHRDIKPGNILIDAGGQPRITDFGLAKRTDSDSGVTKSGQIIGTPSYMPPEQAGGSNDLVGPRADVYSLGATLYCLLTGRPPFQSATVLETLRQVEERDPVAPRMLNPAVDRDLETICLKCLEKNPERRYATALDLAEDLHRFLQGRAILATRIGTLGRLSRWCRRNPVDCLLTATIAFLLVAITTASLLALGHIQTINTELEDSKNQADSNAQSESFQRRRADDQARETRVQLERMYSDKGLELAERGDPFTALLWWTQPFQESHGNCETLDSVRMRLSLYWRFATRDQPEAMVFPGGRCRWVDFSSDGSMIATGNENGDAQVWDARTGQPLSAPMHHRAQVYFVGFCPQSDLLAVSTWGDGTHFWEWKTGRRVVTLGNGNSSEGISFDRDGKKCILATVGEYIRVHSFPEGKPLTPPLNHSRELSWATFDPQGKRVATASWDGSARVWDAETGQPVTAPLCHDSRGVTWVAFSPDGTLVATAGWDAIAKVWDVASGRLLVSTNLHTGQLRQVEFSPDGKQLLTASEDGRAILWDISSGKPAVPPLAHQTVVWRAIFSPDGKWIATGSRDGTARLWETKTGAPLAVFRHQRAIRHVAFDRSGKRLAIASEDGTARVWKIGAKGASPVELIHQPGVDRVECSRDSRRIVTAGFGNHAIVWDPQTGRTISRGPEHQKRVRFVHFSPDSRWVVCGSEDNRATIFESETGKPVCPPLVHRGPVSHVLFRPDGNQVLTASVDQTVVLWDPRTGEKQGSFPVKGQPWHATYSPDGTVIGVASSNGEVTLWSVETKTPIASLPTHGRIARGVVFDPEGKRVASCAEDGNAQICDARTGQPLTPLMRHGAAIYQISFSKDGKWLLTASQDGSAQVWDAESGLATCPQMAHHSVVYRAVFSPDGNWVVTAGGDGSARIWDRASGQAVSPPLKHRDRVFDAIFSEDGSKVITGAGDRCAKVWDVTLNPRSKQDWLKESQWLSGHSIGSNGALLPLSVQEMKQRPENHP